MFTFWVKNHLSVLSVSASVLSKYIQSKNTFMFKEVSPLLQFLHPFQAGFPLFRQPKAFLVHVNKSAVRLFLWF